MVRPNGISAHTRLDKMVGLEGHYKSQGLSVPVRSVSPFSDPSSNLAQPSRSGAVRLATGVGKHSLPGRYRVCEPSLLTSLSIVSSAILMTGEGEPSIPLNGKRNTADWRYRKRAG